MPQYFQRPENALKRANEFIDVGKKQRALDALCDVIKSRKHRTWQKIHEPIMTKYLGLCVELKKSHVAKEGLFQYRNICQQVNIKSLEDVVRGYLALAEEKTESAREESQQVVVDIDDLDQVQTPESLLLSAVSSEDTQDRTDRVVLTPWVKFLWESYRHCLELLRNNSRVERLYHDIAHYAFRFCLKYNRKTEFRKLCDNLRAHLGHIHKHQNQQTSVNLNNPDSQAMHLETRLVQLDSAIQMELWQEAYKAIEDIHGLMSLSKKTPNPRLMANYYQKLALVFWKSNNLLFHAAALFRLFYLSREQKKNITADEISKMASRVVLATLAVPMTPIRSDIDRLVETDENVIDKNQRLLSTLLGLSNPPTRAILIKDLVRFGIIQSAPPQLQDLYRWLETDFHPLKLCGRVQQAFEFFNKSDEFPELRQYIPSIQDITVVRLVKEVSQVYQTIQFSRLLELAPFIQPFDLEYLVVDIARRNDLQVRIDHRKNCFHFGSELNVSQREEIIEGPQLQSMPSEQMRNQLVFIHSVLNKAVNFLLPVKKKLERKELSKEILKAYMHTSSKDHMRILNRQQIIEERKEMLENLNYQKEAKERKILEDKHQKLRDAEKERMAKETEERSKQRLLREQSEMKRKVVLEKIEQLKKTEIFTKMLEGMDELELEKLDPDELLTKQVEQMDKERKELQAKLKTQERKVDHLERAKRIVEIPLLLAENEECQKNDKQFWEQHEEERITTIIEERAMSVQYRDRLLRLKDDRDKFLEQLKKARGSVYEEKLTEFEKLVNEERKKRLKERKEARKEDRKVQRLKLQEEKKQQMIAEAMKREREEALAKLEEMEAKKRAKEKEIEERLKQEKLELKAPISKEDDRDSKSYPDSQRDNDHSDGRDRGVGGSSYSRDRDSYRRDDSSDRRGRDRDGYSSRNESSSKASEGSWRSGGGGSWRDSGKNDKVEDRSAKERDSYSSRNEGSGGYRSRNDGPSSYSSRGDGPSSFSSRGDGASSYSSRRDGGSGFGSRNESSDKPSESSWRSGGGSSTGGSWRDSGRRDNEDRSDRKPPASRGDSYRRDGARRDNEEAGKEREGYSSRNVGSGGYRSRNDGPSNYSSRGDGSGGFGSRNENSDKAPEGGSWRSGGGNTGGSWRDSGRRDNEDRSDRKPPPRGDTYRRDKPRDTDDDGFVQVKR